MLPVQITIRDIPSSLALENAIRKKVTKLQLFYDRISHCHIVVDAQQKHKHQGKLYNLRIDVSVPGKELVSTYKYNEDIYIAMRDAFNAVYRQLEEHAKKRHGRVKVHEDVMHGHVARMVTSEGYGFIEGIDGHEYYFSVTNVSHPNFKQLLAGDAVEFIMEAGNDGRQAQRVTRERHNHQQERTI